MYDLNTPVALLPKVRSRALHDAVRGMPCAVRVSSFVPGRRCSPSDTVVPAHLPVFGKGTGTKVSDLSIAAACSSCHDIVDMRDKEASDYITKNYPTAFAMRLLNALAETQARWVEMGLISGKGWEVRK